MFFVSKLYPSLTTLGKNEGKKMLLQLCYGLPHVCSNAKGMGIRGGLTERAGQRVYIEVTDLSPKHRGAKTCFSSRASLQLCTAEPGLARN